VDYDEINTMRERHPAWRLLRADSAPLVLAFLGRYFVEENHGEVAASELTALLDDALYAANALQDTPRFPRAASEYLSDWTHPDRAWLHAAYPEGSDEVHYNATAAFEKAYSWVSALRSRAFVGTESRLHTLVGLLREIVQGAESDPEVRLADLRRRRDELDREIAEAEAGRVAVLDETGLRDRYQQFAGTARELLSDFREVEENFRALGRGARERIATWEGGKGELLTDLVENRADIASSDQGRSFQAFYDFLLSEARQEELSGLLTAVQSMAAVGADHRLQTVHHDWSEAADRAQRTVRQISEQLRRFLDDQLWLENRRVAELIRTVEAAAVQTRDAPTETGIEMDLPGIGITLPLERPLHDARPVAAVNSLLPPVSAERIDVEALVKQRFVDGSRLAANIRSVVPPRSTARLEDILALFPVEQGVAEIVGYLALDDPDLEVTLAEEGESLVEFVGADGRPHRVRLPEVTVTRA
jgi:hypothetical protein